MALTFFYSFLLLLLLTTHHVLALTPACAPGGNFDMSTWNLQLPIGSPGAPTTISSRRLQGCAGWQDDARSYFYSDPSSGALVTKVPGSPSSAGCVTTPNSKHCRTELREVDPSRGGASASWDPRAPVNRLRAIVSVERPDNSGTGTVIGQIKIDDSVSTKPVCELYYNSLGDLRMGVGQTRAGGDQVLTAVGHVPVGDTFAYEIRYENNVLSVRIDNGAARVLSTYQLNAPRSYFKAGNYNQGSSPSVVRFWGISVVHGNAEPPADPPGTILQPPTSVPSIPANAGIGPFNILTTMDHTVTPPTATPTETLPPAAGPTCDTDAPENTGDNTIALRLFSDARCCTAVQTTTLGTLDTCHNAPQAFRSTREAVGRNMFGRSIHILAYPSANCGGSPTDFKLSNADTCWVDDAASSFLSFRIAVSSNPVVGDPEPPPASTPPPQPSGCPALTAASPASDNVVALRFHDGGTCCRQAQDFSIGTAGVCHNMRGPMTGLVQRAGRNLLARGYSVRVFRNPDCSAGSEPFDAYDLDDGTPPVCAYDRAHTWRSFMLVEGRAGTSPNQPGSPGTPGSACDGFVPIENPSANTVTLQLYGGGGCCDAAQKFTIGTLDACHTASSPFSGVAQRVGANMFGKGTRIELFANPNCDGSSAPSHVDLSGDAARCYIRSGGNKQWRSFRVKSAAPTWPPNIPVSALCPDWRLLPAPYDGWSMTVDLYSADDCCSGRMTKPGAAIQLLGTGACYQVPHGADTLVRAASIRAGGTLLFDNSYTLTFHIDTQCRSARIAHLPLSGHYDVCWPLSDPHPASRWMSFTLKAGKGPGVALKPLPPAAGPQPPPRIECSRWATNEGGGSYICRCTDGKYRDASYC